MYFFSELSFGMLLTNFNFLSNLKVSIEGLIIFVTETGQDKGNNLSEMKV
jgi:hypothetical protein